MTQRMAMMVTMLGVGMWCVVAGGPTAAGQTAGGCATPSFAPAQNFGAQSGASGVTSGDFNRDNNPDLAAANRTADNVSVLLGDGQGGFLAAQNFAAGNSPSSITTADFNAAEADRRDNSPSAPRKVR